MAGSPRGKPDEKAEHEEELTGIVCWNCETPLPQGLIDW